MRSALARYALASLVMIGALLATFPAGAHEGEDHGAPPLLLGATVAPRAEVSSADFEFVVIARGGELVIHLDAFRTNAPIADAKIEIDSPAGLLKPVPREAGVYTVPAPFLAKPGSYDLALTVTAQGTIDILAVTLKIAEPPSRATTAVGWASWLSGPAFAQNLKERVAARGPPFWGTLLAGFAGGTLFARLLWRRRRTASLAAALVLGLLVLQPPPVLADAPSPAVVRDIAQRFPDGAVFVPKPTQQILALRTVFTEERVHQRSVELPGRIVPSPNASGLVQASIGGRLVPPQGGFKPLGIRVKAGDILAYVRPPLPLADATAQQQQARELDQQISIVTRRVERYRALAQSAAIARSQFEDAELELKGLQTRRANLDRVQREPEALVAPVDGIIAAANAVAGQMAEPNAVIFQIIDPAVLWVEALSYEAQAINGSAKAVFSDGRTVELEYLGTGFADRNQAVPIQFAIRGNATATRVGQFVTVLASTSEERRGIAVPREAVLRGSNGQSVVYEHTNAERFAIREVRAEPLDGANVLILAGVEPGRRVVAQGAELLNQIR